MPGRPEISARDVLLDRASEYGIRAAHQAELAETGDLTAASAFRLFTLVELVLREVADALEEAA